MIAAVWWAAPAGADDCQSDAQIAARCAEAPAWEERLRAEGLDPVELSRRTWPAQAFGGEPVEAVVALDGRRARVVSVVLGVPTCDRASAELGFARRGREVFWVEPIFRWETEEVRRCAREVGAPRPPPPERECPVWPEGAWYVLPPRTRYGGRLTLEVPRLDLRDEGGAALCPG
jgi:hypothetical protein